MPLDLPLLHPSYLLPPTPIYPSYPYLPLLPLPPTPTYPSSFRYPYRFNYDGSFNFVCWHDAIYFAVTSVTTVGYGDYAPKTKSGRVILSVYIVFGIGVLSLQV